MAIDNRKPIDTSKSLTNEDLWKQFNPNGALGSSDGTGATDDGDEAKASKGAKGGKGGKLAPKVKLNLDATGPGAPTVGAGAGTSPSPLPTGDDARMGALSPDIGAAAASLPVTTRQTTVANNADLQAAATPLSKAIDKLSDDLASGTATEATLTTDIAAYKQAMVQGKLDTQVAAGLQTMIDGADMGEGAAAQVKAIAKKAGIDLSTVVPATLDQAKAALQTHLADNATDAGVIDLDVQQIKNLTAAPDAESTVSDVVADVVSHAPSGNTDPLAALYAAAAKNGISLDPDKDNQLSAALNAKVQRAPAKKVAQASPQANQSGGGAGGGTSGTSGGGGTGSTSNSGGGGGGGGSSGSISAPTYDKVAAATPYGSKEDLSNWKQNVYPKGQFNEEQQHYTDGGQNITFGADGSATITAKNEGNGDWSSARITGDPVGTLPKYLEATISTPAGQGTWPAFWLVGTGSWPQGGEVDVMEQVNGENSVHASNHWGTETPTAGAMPNGPTAYNTQTSLSDIDMSVPHRYGVNVTDDGVQFYLDGKPYGDKQVYPAESNFAKIASEMVPTINLAMGGTWPADVPNDLQDQTMKVYSMTRSSTPPDKT